MLSQISEKKLATCHPDIQKVIRKVAETEKVCVVYGHRPQAEQDALFYAKPPKTQLKWPDSKHNASPSNAVDIAPVDEKGQIDWNDVKAFSRLAGICMGVGLVLGVTLRWGGDWDQDGVTSDNKFNDLPHLELT